VPDAIFFSGVIRMHVFVSLSSAANSMPCDSTPRSFLGFKFVRTTIFLPFSSSVVYCSFIPEQIILVSSPNEIVSLYSWSAPSISSACFISATCMSSFSKSS